MSVRTAQTLEGGAAMKIELPKCRTASSTGMLGVERVAFLGSVRVAMMDLLDVNGVIWIRESRHLYKRTLT